MAANVRTISLMLPLLVLVALIIMSPIGVLAVMPREYEAMQRVLRGHGYNLVCNAMATSDLQWLLLTLPPNASFTIFAPTDASLFALDMTQTASSYTDTIRFHVVPLRLSVSNLRSLTTGSLLPTLLPSSAIRLVSTRPLSLGRVDIVLPGLFYSRHLAVHGLGGALNLASLVHYGSHSPVTKANPMATIDFNRMKISPEIAPSSSAMTTEPPSSSPTAEQEISPTLKYSEGEITTAASAAPLPLTVDSVAERARTLLMEINSIDGDDDNKSNSISGVDHILGGESRALMMTEAQIPGVNKVEKCEASDEMAIDCFVAEGAVGLEHSGVQRAVLVL